MRAEKGLRLITMPSLMASITIRNPDERTKARLRVRAGHKPTGSLAEAIRRRFGKYGGVEPELPPREPIREPPKLGKPRRR